jgi:hypothetical protein
VEQESANPPDGLGGEVGGLVTLATSIVGFELALGWAVGEVGETDGAELGGRVSPRKVGDKVGVAEGHKLGGALTDG